MNILNGGRWCRLLIILMWVAIVSGYSVCMAADSAPDICNSPAQDLQTALKRCDACPSMTFGYLNATTIPRSLALLPPPPVSGSRAFALDSEYSEKSFDLRDTPAWALAASDADLTFPHAANAFSCVLNATVSREKTPHLYKLLCYAKADAGNSTAAAKSTYNRLRPFQVNGERACQDTSFLASNGSYPSGHNAIGTAWALILAEISPEHADDILARGQAFGLGRVVCNVHWYSDTIQGRYLGADTVARLHADPAFLHDLEAAKGELEKVRRDGPKPTGCDAEKAGVYMQRWLFQ